MIEAVRAVKQPVFALHNRRSGQQRAREAVAVCLPDVDKGELELPRNRVVAECVTNLRSPKASDDDGARDAPANGLAQDLDEHRFAAER